jgi:hypothetical protein
MGALSTFWNHGLIGVLGGAPKRRSKAKASARKPAAAKRAKPPKAKPYRGAATAKASSGKERALRATKRHNQRPPSFWTREPTQKEIVEMMQRAGKNVRTLRNPPRRKPTSSSKGKRSTRPNPSLESELKSAKNAARKVNGTGDVLVLSKRERKPPPRVVVPIGEVVDFTYRPLPGSEKRSYDWRHKVGDRGPLRSKTKNRMYVVEDPKTKRVDVIQTRPAKVDGKWVVG